MKPKHSAGYRLGIINPLTLVGNEIKTILRERSFPAERIVLLDTTGENAGALTEIGEEPAVVTPATPEELDDLDLTFFCGPPAGNQAALERCREGNFIGIDLSQPSSAANGKVVVADVNLEDASGEPLLVSPHPVAIPMALILHQIESISALESCTATVVQPASEFEQAGVEELAQQTVSALNVHSVPQQVFDRQLAFNLYPALEHNEEFIVGQLRKLIDPDAEMALFVTQGTIFHGHTFSLFVRTREELDRHRIIGALQANRAIAFPEGDQAFGTIDAAGRDEVLIAEVRPDPSIRGGFWVWAICDNLRRGSALNGVLIAEKVLLTDSAN
ncbi:MAG TPA: Asd/ArgC dimerization domain-containing protein [Thermoanaerobaculia bacterium]|nr:Asd/ArgC dimerization domain-containing protein [Thermoanaerobaculia bacterium]